MPAVTRVLYGIIIDVTGRRSGLQESICQPKGDPDMTVVPTASTGSTPSSGTAENNPTAAIKRRNRPGTSASSFCNWTEENFDEMESTLAVQQYIQQTIRRDVSDVDAILTAPDSQDEGVWKYEHLRQFSMELNGLAVALQSECQPEMCPQMTATEQWIFLVSRGNRCFPDFLERRIIPPARYAR